MWDIKTQPNAFEYIRSNATARARSMDGLGSSRVDDGKDMKKDLAWPTLPPVLQEFRWSSGSQLTHVKRDLRRH